MGQKAEQDHLYRGNGVYPVSNGFYQKHSLGQHFLTDTRVLEQIIEVADPRQEDAFLEIGPGAGVLTEALAARCGKVLSVEIDRRLEPILKLRLQNHTNVEILWTDFQRVKWAELQEKLGLRFRVAANIPYAITTPILDSLFRAQPSPLSAVLLMQKETAAKLLAREGQKGYGPMAIKAALLTRSTLICQVPPDAFDPPPRVDSAVVNLDWKDTPKVNTRKLDTLLRVAFSARRKQIHNNLGALGWSREEITVRLGEADCLPTQRPEQISPAAYAMISDYIS